MVEIREQGQCCLQLPATPVPEGVTDCMSYECLGQAESILRTRVHSCHVVEYSIWESSKDKSGFEAFCFYPKVLRYLL